MRGTTLAKEGLSSRAFARKTGTVGTVNAVKTPLELAALATAAVPGLLVAGLRPPEFSDEVISVTGLIDVAGDRWCVVCTHDSVGGLDLEAQTSVLSRLARAYDKDFIPFDVPRPSGFTRVPGGGLVMVYRDLGGRFLEDEDFAFGSLLSTSMAHSLAALHNLPDAIYENLDLPSYTAAECRDRLFALLDEAAKITLIPANLWNRWETALEDLSLWRFRPVPVHGDLASTSFIIGHDVVKGMTGFSSAHVGDPAVDIAWILAQASDAYLARFREAYSLARTAPDLHLLTRSQLMSELAIVRWLVHGQHAEDKEILADARAMLTDLSEDLGDEPLVTRSHADSTGVATKEGDNGPAVDRESGGGGASEPDTNNTLAEGPEDLPTEKIDFPSHDDDGY